MNRWLAIVALGGLLAGCDQNMDGQPRYSGYARAPLFRSSVLRRPPENTVARDDLEREKASNTKPVLSAELLARGRERFGIFCSPCHGAGGDGTGMVVQRGMPRPTSYHDDRLRTAEDQYFFDVITNGHGAMYSYAARVPPADRWAIVAYIRALQLSRQASLDDVPADERARLESRP